MGLSAYVRFRGETFEEALLREDGPWFGSNTRSMSAIEEFAGLAGIDTVFGYPEQVTSAQDAGTYEVKLRRFLDDLEPGPEGSLTDPSMCALAEEFVVFLQRAAEAGGYIVD